MAATDAGIKKKHELICRIPAITKQIAGDELQLSRKEGRPTIVSRVNGLGIHWFVSDMGVDPVGWSFDEVTRWHRHTPIANSAVPYHIYLSLLNGTSVAEYRAIVEILETRVNKILME